ncbi:MULTISPECIES: ABC transporter ATP-binding protein [unclassified Caballeronia]|uniref:ABC transporter ATP-binding protein n=1 Tax=unclassified Caballeronia TaxID=2646786 RepID=UPI001FD60900|nr:MULTISPECIES: ABC transporter ATP-binding protein [unclassified Caballeronia]MDR5773356.1 ABC transporter ATP-binding protein [Caballeronia sp. LZ002]MDR5806131.1 ABC transporter ATP-binding protein [Caballeronia sp. LZ001]MDR5848790.1 ABC transporter ATP-binding protein [Caballeronia sp. LZ003]
MSEKIVARGLGLTYENEATGSSLTVLDNFDLSVREGEFLAVLGPSGCGKSTFLSILAGLVPQTAGEITVDGEPVSAARQKLGVVFQGYALFPWRTVRKNVETGLEIRGVKAVQRRSEAERFLRLVGLLDFADHYPHQLSGGMRQRVAIARVLAYGPEILLMDEPFGALDAQTRESLQQELLAIWEQSAKTVVFVTHSIDEAIFLADRVAIMGRGPGRVKEIIDIDLPRPRDASLRHSAAFMALRQRAWASLSLELGEALVPSREQHDELNTGAFRA